MPLVRYEVRCEHRLANPELFRSAARDDPEGLLEGVAVAGLIGIVRQLGDLAEFAAEVFRDLHDELTKVGGRAFDLTVRLHQLEAELPSVENALLSEPNQLRFAYTNGADWHASIRSDQNHCTSGELPRFVRNFYEECRGPPRLFLLDKFDVAGSGACLKRYTDPSFFKLEWARSELMKAQRAQRDKKARREKKKGRRRKTGQAIAAINQIPARVRYGSASLEDLDTLSHLLASTLKDEVSTSSSHQSVNYGPGTLPQRWSNLISKGKVIGDSLPPTGASAPQPVVGSSKPLKFSAKDIEANISGNIYQPCERESVAESMAGKISKIIETRDHDAVPSAGLVSRDVDDETSKGANGSRIPAVDAEIIETRDCDAVPSAGLVSRDVDDETPKGANGSRIPAVDAEIIETRDCDAVPSAGLVSRDVDDETPKGANGSRIPAVDAEIIETRDRDAVPSAGLVSRDVDDETSKGANGSRIPAVDAEIIETRDRDAVPSVGLVSRDVDDETSKGANGSRIPAADAETKVTNRAAKNDLEAGTMARAGRTSWGTSSSNASMDNRGGSNPADWGTSQTSVPDITSRSSVAVDSTEGSKSPNARASQTSMSDVSPMDSIILSSSIVQPTQGPLEQAMQNAPPSFRVEDGDSSLSSPTGSVIIKDTPSPPGSPASEYSECESAIPEFCPPYDPPKGPVSPRSVAHAMENSVKYRKTSSGEMRVRDPRFVSSQSVAAGAVRTQEGGPLNLEAEIPDHVHSLPENRVEAPPSHIPAQHDTAHEETSLHAALPPTPHLDSGPNSSFQSTEAATPGAVLIWATPNLQDSSASNFPLDSPPRKTDLARADEGLTSEWRGRSQPGSTSGTGIIRVPESPCRSPSNSPPTSPPKFSDQSNFLRWKGRSEISTIKTDYALPPNLVCLSETSSPPCSPPSQSHGESPKQWDQRSEVLSSSDSSENSDSTEGIQHGAVEVYRLPDSPLPLDSPAMSEGGDSLSGSSSKSESDEEVDDADENEHEDEHANEVEHENEHGHEAEHGAKHEAEHGTEQGSEQASENGSEQGSEQGSELGTELGMLQTSTSESVLENPSNSSLDKSSFEIASFESKIPNGSIQLTDAQFRPSTFDTSAGPVLPISLSQRNSTLTPTAGDETNPILNIDPPLPPAALGSTDTSASKNALAAAIAHHDWNMMKALTFKDPGNRPFPPPDERSILLEQMRTESATLHRSGDGMERNDHITRPSANINVAAILEKANAIRQAFVGSDDEDGDGGDWSDS